MASLSHALQPGQCLVSQSNGLDLLYIVSLLPAFVELYEIDVRAHREGLGVNYILIVWVRLFDRHEVVPMLDFALILPVSLLVHYLYPCLVESIPCGFIFSDIIRLMVDGACFSPIYHGRIQRFHTLIDSD